MCKELTQQQMEVELINFLIDWACCDECEIIFDSDLNGNGDDLTLFKSVWNKRNLCFICIDGNGNVFGGYLTSTIDQDKYWIRDEDAFVFSLMRNGEIKEEHYPIRINLDGRRAFELYGNRDMGALYEFGDDIYVCKVGCYESKCKKARFSYYKEELPFVDNEHPHSFKVERIIILQMD
ncbi:TLDc domain-containing protein [Entamoeba marina]